MMNSDHNKSELLRHGPVFKAICSIAVPMAVVMAVNALFSYLDIWFVSRLGDEVLHTMDMLFPYLNLSSCLIYAGLCTGVSVAVARQCGSANKQGIACCLKAGLIMTIPIWILLSAIAFCGQGLLFARVTDQCRAMGGSYSFWYLLSFPIMAAGCVICSVMRGSGNAARPAFYSVLCIIIKAVLTPLLCFGAVSFAGYEFSFLDMGIRGAAISSGISYVIFLLLMIRELDIAQDGLVVALFKAKPQWPVYKNILRSAVVAVQVPVLASVVLMVVLAVMGAKDSYMADAFSLAKRFELYLIQFTVCLGSATMVVMSSSMAVNNYRRAREVAVTSLKILSVIAVPTMLWMSFNNDLFYYSLTANESIVAHGQKYFTWGGLSTLSLMGMILLSSAFQGIGCPARALPFQIFSIVIVQGGGSLLLQMGLLDSTGYYILISAGSVLSFLVALNYLMNSTEIRSETRPPQQSLQQTAASSFVTQCLPRFNFFALYFVRVCFAELNIKKVLLVVSAVPLYFKKALLTTLLIFVTPSIKSSTPEQPDANSFAQTSIVKYQIDLTNPVHTTSLAVNHSVALRLDDHGFPVEYSLPLTVDICLTGSCKILKLTLFWDAIGNYLRLEYPPTFPLTKNKHDLFSKDDYKKLDEILKSRYSILGQYPLNHFVLESKPQAKAPKVDAITAATPIAVRDAVVRGAAYTSWALWHWANGQIVEKLRSQTMTYCSETYLLNCLRSDDARFVKFGLERLEDKKSLTAKFVKECFTILKQSGRENCELALNILIEKTSDPEGLKSRLIGILGENSGSSRLLLNYFETLTDVSKDLLGQFSVKIRELTDPRDISLLSQIIKIRSKDRFER